MSRHFHILNAILMLEEKFLKQPFGNEVQPYTLIIHTLR